MTATARASVFAFDIKSIAEDGTFSGYASTFGNVDNGNDICAKGCFANSLREHSANKSMPGMFWRHDSGEPIGEWLTMSEDERGLYVEGQLWVGTGIPKAEQAYRLLKSAGPKGLSIGFVVVKASYNDKAGVRILEQVDLKETSVVPFPMNTQAKITSVKGDNNAALIQSINAFATAIKDATR